VEKPGMEKFFTLLLTYITHLPLPNNWLYAVLFIALFAFAVGLLQTFRAHGQSSSGLWLLYLSFTPAILVFLVSQWVPIYIERAFLPSGVIFCIWLAWAFFDTGLPKLLRYVLVGGLFISFSMGIFQHVTYRGFPYAPYREINQYLRSQAGQEDLIIHSNKLTLLPAVYFDRTLPQIYIADPPGSSTDTLAKATQEVLGVTSVRNIELATQQAEELWLVIFERSIQESRSMGMNTHPHLQFLEQNFERVSVEAWDGLQVFHFRR
jgi:hypothetical protein